MYLVPVNQQIKDGVWTELDPDHPLFPKFVGYETDGFDCKHEIHVYCPKSTEYIMIYHNSGEEVGSNYYWAIEVQTDELEDSWCGGSDLELAKLDALKAIGEVIQISE